MLANSLIATYRAIGGGWEIRYGIRGGGGDGMIESVPVPMGDDAARADQLEPAPAAEPKAADPDPADPDPAVPDQADPDQADPDQDDELMLPPVPKDE